MEEFPSSDLAVQLISGQSIGVIAMPELEAEIAAICSKAPSLCSDDPPAIVAANRAFENLLANNVNVLAVIPAVILARQGDTMDGERLVPRLQADPAALPYLALLLNEIGYPQDARQLADSAPDPTVRYVTFILIGAFDDAKALSSQISLDAMSIGTVQQAPFMAQVLGLATAQELASVLPDGNTPPTLVAEMWMMVGDADRALSVYGDGDNDFNKVNAVEAAMKHGHLDAARTLADTISNPGAAVIAHALALQPDKARAAFAEAEADPTFAAYLAAVTNDVDGAIAGVSQIAVNYVPDLAGILAGSSDDAANVEAYLQTLRSEVEFGRVDPTVYMQAVTNAATALALKGDLASLEIADSVSNPVQQAFVLARVSAELSR